MTEKWYYTDPYLRRFTATVTGCEPAGTGWRITLDRTAFYPEGGGQPGDSGQIGGVRVSDTHEKGGEVFHTAAGPLEPGRKVEAEIDWDRRFSLMQNHSGEHIVSGIIHRLFGLDNVGFHMGSDAVTIDLSGELDAEQLAQVEQEANHAVWADREIQIAYPDPEALARLDYRSKKELTGAVRIVTVPGSDVCACCGTHVRRTGEIGAIKLLTSQRSKGGVRVWMLCGARALADYAAKNTDLYAISGLLSAKIHETVPAVERLLAENAHLEQWAAQLEKQLFAMKAERFAEGTDRAVVFEEGLDHAALRRYCQALCARAGLAAAFSPDGQGGWRYVLGSTKRDPRPLGKALNQAFSGRGGGNRELVQGTILGGQPEIAAFCETLG